MAMRDRERGTVFWSFGYPENIDQTHQVSVDFRKIISDFLNYVANKIKFDCCEFFAKK